MGSAPGNQGLLILHQDLKHFYGDIMWDTCGYLEIGYSFVR